MEIRFACLRQHVRIEGRFEVAITFDANTGSTLKFSFRELRFDQKISDSEIHFGPLNMICDQGYSGLAAELKPFGRPCAE